MLGLIPAPGSQALRVLCIGAHCDDIDIGCGGTLLQMQKVMPDLTIDWVVLTGGDHRQAEVESAMQHLIQPAAQGRLLFGGFPDARLPSVYAELKDYFEGLRQQFNPDLIFCHERHDLHQDHRIVNEMTWGTFRDHLILEYEIFKWDGGLGTPNTYVPLDADVVEKKIGTLLSVYGSQRDKHWFTRDNIASIMRIRGVECRAAAGYAEAFTGRKILIQPG